MKMRDGESLEKCAPETDSTDVGEVEREINASFKNVKWIIAVALSFCIIAGAAAGVRVYISHHPETAVSGDVGWDAPDYVQPRLLMINEYSRPGTKLERVSGLVIHYVANAGTSAEANRSYFAGLASSGATYASSNFIIGLDGEVLQCVPADEVAYCSNTRNSDTLSIECCHPAEDGKFSEETYDSLVRLAADLSIEFGLDPERDIIRHYDITQKMCPLYYVEHPDAWETLISDISDAVSLRQDSAYTAK